MNPVLVDPWQVGRPMLEPTAHKAFPARMFKQQQKKDFKLFNLIFSQMAALMSNGAFSLMQ